MHNLSINFSYWWLLFLLIPAIALTLIPYFRLSKKYRKTRNRITSMTLHIIVMVLAVSVLSGMMFSYQLYNDQNEVILLVDVSETSEQSQAQRDEFVETALDLLSYDNYKVGVVTFGFNQVYAVPLTTDVRSIYDRYLLADLPDTGSTDIAAALTYAKDLFAHPKTSKIVLITDGKENDDNASSAIRSVTAKEIRVDVVNINSNYNGSDVQVMGIELPSQYVGVDQNCTIKVMLQSESATNVTVNLYDNGMTNRDEREQTPDLIPGTNTLTFNHKFETSGFHEIAFKIIANGDLLPQNNQYVSYLELKSFDQILILESRAGESVELVKALQTDGPYTVKVVNINEDIVPATVDELRLYDQIILNNISNANLRDEDMPVDFDKMLYEYVEVYGGGILTTGGENEFGELNAYNRSDMIGSLYQQMLPVQAVNYTPPMGVVVIIDRSGSMGVSAGGAASYLDWAKAGASSVLSALSERDFIGIMTLDKGFSTVLPLTARTHEAEILKAINSIEKATGTTSYTGAITTAGAALVPVKNQRTIDKAHIIIISDGAVPTIERESYEKKIKELYNSNGITLSVVGVNMTAESAYDINTPIETLDDLAAGNANYNYTDYQKVLRAAILGNERGKGRLYTFTGSQMNQLSAALKRDLSVPELKEVYHETFSPTAIINNYTEHLFNGVDCTTDGTTTRTDFGLDGFYGVRLRNEDGVRLALLGEYNVPIYAYWKVGKGSVGSFMSDLNGTWSANFLNEGKALLYNIINGLMPMESIRPNQISVMLNSGEAEGKNYNYANRLSVITKLDKDQRVEGTITTMSAEDELVISLNAVTALTQDSFCYVTSALTAANKYSGCTFVIKQAGVYKITLTKFASDDTVIDVYETYKAFSYSKEYDSFTAKTTEELGTMLLNLADSGNGAKIADLEDPIEITEGFVNYIDDEFDPRMLFIILAIVLFLLDIAVRKFKFKWPHELYRDYKNKKAENKKNA